MLCQTWKRDCPLPTEVPTYCIPRDIAILPVRVSCLMP